MQLNSFHRRVSPQLPAEDLTIAGEIEDLSSVAGAHVGSRAGDNLYVDHAESMAAHGTSSDTPMDTSYKLMVEILSIRRDLTALVGQGGSPLSKFLISPKVREALEMLNTHKIEIDNDSKLHSLSKTDSKGNVRKESDLAGTLSKKAKREIVAIKKAFKTFATCCLTESKKADSPLADFKTRLEALDLKHL